MARQESKYITPPNFLKQKVGSGGLPPSILNNAQKEIEENTIDFSNHTQSFLDHIQSTIEKAQNSEFRTHDHVKTIIYPVMQLKAHCGMFGQPLVSEIAGSALSFLENIYVLDDDAITVLQAHYNAIKPILENRIQGLGGAAGHTLVQELRDVCYRYYNKYSIEPEN